MIISLCSPSPPPLFLDAIRHARTSLSTFRHPPSTPLRHLPPPRPVFPPVSLCFAFLRFRPSNNPPLLLPPFFVRIPVRNCEIRSSLVGWNETRYSAVVYLSDKRYMIFIENNIIMRFRAFLPRV